jgi:anthranilate phosphoribosyltransferase
MESFKPLIAKVAAGATLTRTEAESAFDSMLSGEVTPSQMGGFLMALRVRGETVDEITGAVAAMRAKMIAVKAPAEAIDIVGTGGDGSGSLNVSTLAAIITAACGVTVAKHGNRAASSRSGAADTLAALGVKIGLTPDGVERCIQEAGIGFMMAPAHHASMRHVGPTRVELGTRTLFNILGPLSNPAGVKRQLVGVFSAAWLEPMAEVTHGLDGLDEITTTGPTKVVELKGGALHAFELTPEAAGLPRSAAVALKGGEPAHNAKALKDVLYGVEGAYRDIGLMTTGAALVIAGKASSIKEGVDMGDAAIRSGAARRTLDRLIAASNA